ncbi:MAG: alcohol dehydrogenase catalytic domain-containing protein [Candidatus Planktophila sp.]
MSKSIQEMTAIVKTALGPDSISIVSWPRPVPNAGQVIVEVHGAGVCGTDLHIALDAYPNIPPVVMGHEVAGTVVEIGEGVDAKWMGVRVACETHHQICKCNFCRDGRRNLCKNKASMGSFVDGGFATYVAVAEELLHPMPDGITDHEAALTEPLACICHLLLDPPLINVADQVLVTGPGPMGLLAAQVARAAGGIVTISGLEKDRIRLGVALELGFMITHSPEPESFDIVIECSGSEGGIRTALQSARRGARYVAVGIVGHDVNISADAILYKELLVSSGFATTPQSWNRALKLLEHAHVSLSPLISRVEPLKNWPIVYKDLRNADVLKIVFDPRI